MNLVAEKNLIYTTPTGELQHIFIEAVFKSYGNDLYNIFKAPKIEKIKTMISKSVMYYHFGEYQSIFPMSFHSFLKKKKLLGKNGLPSNRDEIGSDIIQHLPFNKIINTIELTDKGFLSFTVDNHWLSQKLTELYTNGTVVPPKFEKRNVIVDYSSPNIAKTMHVGHLRSTIIGNCVYKMFKYCGCDVTGLNHFGDCGTQFGMLLEYIHRNHPDFLELDFTIHDLEKMYKLSKKCFDDDDGFKVLAKQRVVELQSGNGWAHNIWKRLVEISKVNYQEIYDILKIEDLIDRGESFYIPFLPGLVNSLEEFLDTEDNGAKVIRVPKYKGVFMVRKGDGGYGYDSTDLAAIRQRLTEMDADQIVYVTDIGQQLHFHKLFEVAKMIGWSDGTTRLDHLGFGLILSKEGGKFRTRSGKVIHLIDLLKEAKRRSKVLLEERVEKGMVDFDEAQIDDVSSKIGYGAVKFFDLQLNINKNYVFDYDKMLSMNGKTSVYVQYTYARISSVLRKMGYDLETIHNKITNDISIVDPKEHDLALELSKYQEYISKSIDTLSPCVLCEYSYKLATKFNEFYGACHIKNHENKNSRLQLCTLTARILKQFLYLLGIDTVEQI